MTAVTKVENPTPTPGVIDAEFSHVHVLRGTSTLLIGPPGSGKTHSLVTLVKAGLELFVLITDPGGEESLIDACEKEGVDISHVHWRYIAPASEKWGALLDMAKRINLMGYKDLTEIKQGISKSEYHQFYDLLSACANFTCDHCGEKFGPIDSWGPDRALAVDSLSGINVMAMNMMIGAKPAAHQGEWGVAMNAEEKLILKLCADLKCFFILVAHVEREMDETIGKPQLMVGALGRKLAPKLPRSFSDVVLAIKEGDKFRWSTTALNVDLKARALPLSDTLPPTFEQIVSVWKKRMELTQQRKANPTEGTDNE